MVKKLIGGFLVIMASVLCDSTLSAQEPQIPQLPQDSALVKGVLDNGLTYYIRHNETPRGQADFYIAQKVGSILEEDEQRGLAHFLEHMCFNGTQNFPGKLIINWLESVGVKFGRNLNAYTSVDETVYNISAVPVARTSVQDSCLLILHDWACALTLAPEEIDAERGVIHEEWRVSNVGQMRILDQLLPTIYPNSRYGYRLPIGTMEVVDNFPYQALIDYYHKWYRPDQQAVIVVGDIDPAYIESKIKEIFSPIPMPENAAERVYYPVEDNEGTIYAIGSDVEQEHAMMSLYLKNDQILVPDELKNTQMYFVFSYIKRMISSMLNQRLEEAGKEPDCQYSMASINFGDFLLARTKGALDLTVISKTDDIVAAYGDAYRELLRADQYGFTIGELERARQDFLSDIDRLYQERNNVESSRYTQEYVRNFTENEPAPGIAVEKELYEQYAQMLPLEMINEYFQSIVTDDNRVLIALLPKKDGLADPTEEQFAAMTEKIEDEDLEAYKDEMREDPLIPNLPTSGSVLSTRELPEWGAKEYMLSNGVKVIVKTTNYKANQVVFSAVALGKGEASLDQAEAPSIMFAGSAMTSYGINDYSNSDLTKYLSGKQVDLNMAFDAATRKMSGNTTSTDLASFMEILYGYFTGFNITEKEYASTQSMLSSLLRNQESNPQMQFIKLAYEKMYEAPSAQFLTSAAVDAAKRDVIIDIIRNMLSNAADYTFFFVGDINEETFVPLIEQYIATLPADITTATTSYEYNKLFEYAEGTHSYEQKTAMETPQSWVFIAISGSMPYTAKNKYMLQAAAQVLSKRLLNKVREEMGATYSISASGNMSRTKHNNCFIQIPFPMKPEFLAETLPTIKQMVSDLTTNITEEELTPAIEYFVKQAREGLEKNESWAEAMQNTCVNGVQTFTNAEEVATSITVADVQNFMKELLDQNNYMEVVLNPEETTAPADK